MADITPPVAEYRFDSCSWDGTANEVIDSSNNNYNGQTINNTQHSNGIINNASYFTGGDWDTCNRIETELQLNTQEDFSFSFWININDINTSQEYTGILSKKIEFYIDKDKAIIINMKNKTTNNNQESFASTDNIFELNKWYLITIVSSDKDIKIYLDNDIIIDETMTYDKTLDDQDLILGRTGWSGSSPFDGSIDELKLFNYALTSTQIQEIYDNESAHKNYDDTNRTRKYYYPYANNFDAETKQDHWNQAGDWGISGTNHNAWEAYSPSYFLDNNPSEEDQRYHRDHYATMNGYITIPSNASAPTLSYMYKLNLLGAYDYISIQIEDLSNPGTWENIKDLKLQHNHDTYTKEEIDLTAYKGKSIRIRFRQYFDGTTGTRIFVVDDFEILNGSQAIFNAVNRAGGCFNWDNNITTKIAGADINITILSADANDGNNSLADVNITKLELLSFSDASCSVLYDITELWTGNQDVNTSACWNPTLFQHDRAVKCAKIRISGLYDGNTVESNATDTFSIRPDKFVLSGVPSGKLTAEANYTFQAKAVNSDGTTVSVDFNQSVTPTSKKYFRDGTDGSAMDGTFVPTADFNFTDGQTTDTTLSFNNVGKIGLELNDTTWAEVDSDDTPLEDRTIYLEHNLTFIPDRFEITFDNTPTMDNHDGKSFTYYANDLAHMGADLKNLDFKITARGKSGGVMTNYQTPMNKWFANNINLSLNLSVDKNPTLLSSENKTESSFTAGVKTVTYNDRNFNFGRERNVTKNPITIDGANSDINVTAIDKIDHEVNGTINQNFNGDATFYYGRIKTKDIRTNDIRTNDTSVDANVKVQIYSSSNLAGFHQDSQNWYLNELDDFSEIGER